jgi:hypothetical protein
MCRIKALALVALFVPIAALAAATVTSVRGDVRARATDRQAGAPIAVQQRLTPGVTITTGRNAQTLLRFDDGQTILLEQNSVFQILDFRYRDEPKSEDRAIMALLRGSARFVTGDMARRDPKAFELGTPHTILNPRGTDFMVAVTDSTYVRVLQGAVAANTSYGTVVFGPGQVGFVVARSTMPVIASPATVPATVSTAFAGMQTISLPGGVAGAFATADGAGSATSSAGGGLSTGAIVGIAAAAALVAAAAGGGGGGGGSSSTTSH